MPDRFPDAIGVAAMVRAVARRLVNSATPGLDARILVQAALDLDDVSFILEEQRVLTKGEVSRIEELVVRRERHEPIAYITGFKEFWSLEFMVRPGVLVPRADSECLIEAAIARRPGNASLRILDLGAGSGCILCALLHEFPNAFGVGVDCSRAAAALARENAIKFGLDRRAGFVVSDWARALSSAFDIIISNPPYIRESDRETLPPDISKFEDPAALFAGETGLGAYCEILADAPRLIADDGLIIIEIGDRQSAPLAALAGQAFPHGQLLIRHDLAGKPRALVIDLAQAKKTL